ncbi:MAG: hypothetical protein QW057_01215 [Candidatus Bathyarchaeia archaeon]
MKPGELQAYDVRDSEGRVVETQRFRYWALRPEHRATYAQRMRGHPLPAGVPVCPSCGGEMTEASILELRDEKRISGYIVVSEHCGREVTAKDHPRYGLRCLYKFFERVVPRRDGNAR